MPRPPRSWPTESSRYSSTPWDPLHSPRTTGTPRTSPAPYSPTCSQPTSAGSPAPPWSAGPAPAAPVAPGTPSTATAPGRHPGGPAPRHQDPREPGPLQPRPGSYAPGPASRHQGPQGREADAPPLWLTPVPHQPPLPAAPGSQCSRLLPPAAAVPCQDPREQGDSPRPEPQPPAGFPAGPPPPSSLLAGKEGPTKDELQEDWLLAYSWAGYSLTPGPAARFPQDRLLAFPRTSCSPSPGPAARLPQDWLLAVQEARLLAFPPC